MEKAGGGISKTGGLQRRTLVGRRGQSPRGCPPPGCAWHGATPLACWRKTYESTHLQNSASLAQPSITILPILKPKVGFEQGLQPGDRGVPT